MKMDDYIRMLQSMRVKKINGRLSPHKAVMLLAVIDIIEFGLTDGNRFYLDEETESSYQFNWTRYVPENVFIFKPNPWTPFWHLHKEPFWHFAIKKGEEGRIDCLVPKGQTASIGKMRNVIKYAYLDEDLYNLLKTEDGRSLFKKLLFDIYISPLT